MHHQARAATSWGSGYFSTFLMPSAALLPLEYCLPLMGDLDIVGARPPPSAAVRAPGPQCSPA